MVEHNEKAQQKLGLIHSNLIEFIQQFDIAIYSDTTTAVCTFSILTKLSELRPKVYDALGISQDECI